MSALIDRLGVQVTRGAPDALPGRMVRACLALGWVELGCELPQAAN